VSEYDYDVLVIGSGFGGAVSALRLTEKGYRVGVLEAGRRFADGDFPASSWRIRDYIWAPRLGCYGLLRPTLLRNVLIFSGAGVGGGSLVYANTLYEPLDAFYRDPQWAHITDWRAELEPYYAQAKRMLGVALNPATTAADRVMHEVAEDMGVADTYHRTPVGVFFGAPGTRPGDEVADPYFGGAGPSRRACTSCGECMTGCRHNAKNTLVKNYLYLAEAAGATVHPLTTVTAVRPLDGGGYSVETRRTDRWSRQGRSLTAEQVIFAAASLGTQRLLHSMRDRAILPRISPRLGELSRTNSEAVLAARALGSDVDYSRGVAITSSFHPDDVTHVEPVRYGRGSNLLSLMGAPLVDGGQGRARWRLALREYRRMGVRSALGLHSPRDWSQQSIIVLVMQSLNNSITTYTRRGWWGRRSMTSRQGLGNPNPDWIPIAHDVTRRVAEKIDGVPGGSSGDLVNIPTTAHFIGGCVIGSSAEDGVIDPYQRLYGHAGLHVVDGSAISANLGVNPSLTITAQAERALAFWPNKGQPDPRPELGQPYRRIVAVAPESPAVPADAPAALRLPIRAL
jgi:cholesterol oxidase